MRVLRAMTSLAASAISRGNRNRQLRQIDKANQKNRNILNLGRVTAIDLLPDTTYMGNICLSGRDTDARRQLVIQSIKSASSQGEPVIVLHEGDTQLVTELTNACCFQNHFRVINSRSSFYEPIIRLRDEDISSLIISASHKDHKIPDEGRIFLEAILRLLRKSSINPYLKKLTSCPYGKIQSVVLSAEQAGLLTSDEADEIRNDIDLGATSRPTIEHFFSELKREGRIITDKANLYRSTSVIDCIRNNGVLVIDIGSMSNHTLISLIVGELLLAKNIQKNTRLVISGSSISSAEPLKDYLKSAPNHVSFTVNTEDIGSFAGTDKSELEAFMALSHIMIMFAHGVCSSELLSAELGEYDYIEAHLSHSGNTGVGEFGLHFGANNSIKPEHKRERVVQPEKLKRLKSGEFIMMDNQLGCLFSGAMIY